jgi:putative redox protein
MDATVSWVKDLIFSGVADSGYPVKMDSKSSPDTGVGPVELVAIALAGCTAMDVISILGKKRQDVTSFDVKVHAYRATDYPKVITKAALEYLLVGHEVDEQAVLTAIDRSIQKYCPVHAMLEKAFPIEFKYYIYEDKGIEQRELVKQGTYQRG